MSKRLGRVPYVFQEVMQNYRKIHLAYIYSEWQYTWNGCCNFFFWINRCIRKTVLRTNHAIRWIFHSWKSIFSIFYCVWFWPFSDNRLSYNILQNWVRVRLAAGLENSQFVLEFPEFCPQTYIHLYSLPWAYPHKRRPWCHPGVAIWVLLKLRRQVLI